MTTRTRYYGSWHGGYNYSPNDPTTDLEAFDSLEHARRSFAERRDSNGIYRCSFTFVNRPEERCYCHGVGEEAQMYLWVAHVDYVSDDGTVEAPEYPDYVVSFGTRGGVKVERA